jgi:hypothetical protein
MPRTEFAPSSDDETLEAMAESLVGLVSLELIRERVCCAMLRAALARTSGNYSHTAELLGVKRQAVQQMVSRFQLGEWVRALKAATPPRSERSAASKPAPASTHVAPTHAAPSAPALAPAA